MLGVDKSTVYRMAADGRLAAVKVGRQWRFPAGPLHDLLGSVGVESTPSRPIDVQPIIDLAASMLGVMMVATDMDGRPLSAVANPCPWFAERSDDPAVLDACISDWRGLAKQLEFEPTLAAGSHGFECARAFIREGDRLVGMVLAGGIVPPGEDRADLYSLTQEGRAAVIAALPKIAATVSRVATRPHRSTS